MSTNKLSTSTSVEVLAELGSQSGRSSSPTRSSSPPSSLRSSAELAALKAWIQDALIKIEDMASPGYVPAENAMFAAGVAAAVRALDEHYNFYAMTRPSWMAPIITEATGVDVDAQLHSAWLTTREEEQ